MLQSLSNLLTVLIALSVASERLVEISKNLVPWLRTERPTANAEALRKLALQVLAVGAGVATAFLAEQVLPAPLHDRQHLLVLGLLASGGSGFWTSVLGYIGSVKDIKKTQAIEAHVQAAATVAAIANSTAAPAATRRTLSATGAADVPSVAAAVATANLQNAIARANARL